ncbi:MAG: hypothetical protein QXL15_00590 [Candidatus Korarchaeota archaeon]
MEGEVEVRWQEVECELILREKNIKLIYTIKNSSAKNITDRTALEKVLGFIPMALVGGWEKERVLIAVHEPNISPFILRQVQGNDHTVGALPHGHGWGFITESESIGFTPQERAVDMAAIAWESGLNIHIAKESVLAWSPSRPARQIVAPRMVSLKTLEKLLPVLNKFATNVNIGEEPTLAIFAQRRSEVQELVSQIDKIIYQPWGSFSENISDAIILGVHSKPVFRVGGEELYKIIPRLRKRIKNMLVLEKKGKVPYDRAPFSCPKDWPQWVPCPRMTPMMRKANVVKP